MNMLQGPRGVLRAAVIAGTIAGLTDLVMATIINWVSPLRVLRAVASGLLGVGAFKMGSEAALLGLILQVAMSILIAGIYVAATRALSGLNRRPLGAGLLFGVAVFVVMNYVVVPLSAAVIHPAFTARFILPNLAAMIIFSLIITTLTARLARTAR